MKKIIAAALVPLFIVSLFSCSKEGIFDGADSTVNLKDPALEWSQAQAAVVLGSSSNTFPVLSNEYGVSVSYSSSNEEVATVEATSDGVSIPSFLQAQLQ